MARHHWWSDKEKEYLKENCRDKTAKQLSIEMSKLFDIEYTVHMIEGAIKRYKFSPGKCTRFKKGTTPWNKGLKGYMGANATSFKKGSIPPNLRPIGSERTNVEGYTEIKIGKGKWILKHRYLYQQYNGEIPKGYVVIFANGNKQDFSKENLIAITRNQLKTINKHKLFKDNIETTKAGILIADIIIKSQELKRGKNTHESQ